jgi:hypothetical protein
MPEPLPRQEPLAGGMPPDWVAKLEIRELLERFMRYVDDRDGTRLVALFDQDAVLQLSGTVYSGREELAALFSASASGPPDQLAWTEPGELLKQPGSLHISSNPVIEVDGTSAQAETDFFVIKRDETGRARISLAGRYRDRLSRNEDGRWVITNRTGVSVARPGDEGTDAEWQRALGRMPAETRAKFRM